MSRYSLTIGRMLSLVPTAMRKPNLLGLMGCMLAPVAYIHALFTAYRQRKEYRLAHTGQVYSLSQVVRDFCDDDGCHITDGTYIEEVPVPYDAEGELANYQVWVPCDGGVSPAVTVPSAGLGAVAQDDFIVHLTSGLYGEVDEDSLRAVIDEYRPAGKFYGIVYDGIVVETYSFAWGNPVCQLVEQPVVETFAYSWGSPVCVLDEVFTFAWSNIVCVKREIPEPYSYVWSNNICVKTAVLGTA